jgi:hypothetical protein
MIAAVESSPRHWSKPGRLFFTRVRVIACLQPGRPTQRKDVGRHSPPLATSATSFRRGSICDLHWAGRTRGGRGRKGTFHSCEYRSVPSPPVVRLGRAGLGTAGPVYATGGAGWYSQVGLLRVEMPKRWALIGTEEKVVVQVGTHK